jgi:methionine synthase II (cobalamin-independent)
MDHAPQIPLWPQLPCYPEEWMTRQYNEGMPGLTTKDDKVFFATSKPDFDSELMSFYERYLQAVEMEEMPLEHTFGISPHYARGFHAFLSILTKITYTPAALKGHITGPITLATSITDEDGKSAYFDSRLREVIVKTLSLKAKWQIHQLRKFGSPVIISIDEPSLAAYGSSAFLGISEEDVRNDLQEIIELIHAEGGIAGLHCCENTDWGLLMRTAIDILSFDAYGFFDRVVLYAHDLRDFLNRGKVLAWGLIPTGDAKDIKAETGVSLAKRWKRYVKELTGFGFDPRSVHRQSLLTPSCGTGSLPPALSQQVMKLLGEVSEILRGD